MDSEHIHKGMRTIADTARALEEHGWGKGFFGNISMDLGRLNVGEATVIEHYEEDLAVEELIGSVLLITRSGSTMMEIATRPDLHVGAYLVTGGSLDLLHGEGPPTSELGSHLLIHGIAGEKGIVHCHFEEMALIEQDMASEGGFGWVRDLDPGSRELALATLEEARRHDTIIWKAHGIISFAGDLRSALLQISRAHEGLILRDEAMLVPGE